MGKHAYYSATINIAIYFFHESVNPIDFPYILYFAYSIFTIFFTFFYSISSPFLIKLILCYSLQTSSLFLIKSILLLPFTNVCRILSQLAQSLNQVANERAVAIVLINHVTTRIEKGNSNEKEHKGD